MSCISDHPRLPTSNKLCFCFHWDSVLLWRLISKPLILLPPPLLSADTRYLPSQPVPRRHPSPVLMGRSLLGGKGRVGEINSPAASLPGYASEHSACQRSQIHVEGSHTCTQIKAIFFKTSEDEIKFQTLNHLSNLWIWHICILPVHRFHSQPSRQKAGYASFSFAKTTCVFNIPGFPSAVCEHKIALFLTI